MRFYKKYARPAAPAITSSHIRDEAECDASIMWSVGHRPIRYDDFDAVAAHNRQALSMIEENERLSFDTPSDGL